MNENYWIDTGVIVGPSLIHFTKAARARRGRLAELILVEHNKDAWGVVPKDFTKNVMEHLSMATETQEVLQMTENGMHPLLMKGHPDIAQAAEKGTLRLLVGKESDGRRSVACMIIEGGQPAPTSSTPSTGTKPPAGALGVCLALLVVIGVGIWLWRLPSATLNSAWKGAITGFVLIPISLLIVRRTKPAIPPE